MSKDLKIAVVSDSHDNMIAVDKAIKVIKDRGISTVIHLGDFVAPFTLLRFIDAGLKVFGVYGNNDGEKLGLRRIAERNGSEIYDPPHVLLLGGRKILLLHGVGPADESREYAEALASSGYYDVVLYGHTHVIDSRMIKSTLLLNPGELYGYLTGRSSIAILDLQKMDVEIVIL